MASGAASSAESASVAIPRTPTGQPLDGDWQGRLAMLEPHAQALGDMWGSMRQELDALHRRVDGLELQGHRDTAELRQAVGSMRQELDALHRRADGLELQGSETLQNFARRLMRWRASCGVNRCR